MGSNNSLDDIIKCDITITTPASDESSFGTVLLVVPEVDGVGTAELKGVIKVTQLIELKDYGITEKHLAYEAVSVAFAQSPTPSELYLIVRSDEETIKETLDRALENNVWYGIHLTAFDNEADINDAKEWAEANAKLFGFEYSDIDEFPITKKEYYRTFAIYSESKYAALAWMVKCFGYDPGSETWALKSLAVIEPSLLSSADKALLDKDNISYYLRYAGKNIINSAGGKVLAGEWIDTIRFRDWLKNDMQVRIFNLLATNKKIPYEDSGITAIEGQMLASLASGQQVGGIANTAYDVDGNAIPGYTVKVPRAADISDTQKAKRRLSGCKFTARLAGAIQMATISGNLTY